MTALYGRTSSMRFAWFDHRSCSVKTCQGFSAADSLALFSKAWPPSGTWDRGYAYAHPISAHHIVVNEHSSSPLRRASRSERHGRARS